MFSILSRIRAGLFGRVFTIAMIVSFLFFIGSVPGVSARTRNASEVADRGDGEGVGGIKDAPGVQIEKFGNATVVLSDSKAAAHDTQVTPMTELICVGSWMIWFQIGR